MKPGKLLNFRSHIVVIKNTIRVCVYCLVVKKNLKQTQVDVKEETSTVLTIASSYEKVSFSNVQYQRRNQMSQITLSPSGTSVSPLWGKMDSL